MILIHTRAALISIVVPIRAIHARLQWEDREDRPLQDLPSITQRSRQVDPGKDVTVKPQGNRLLAAKKSPGPHIGGPGPVDITQSVPHPLLRKGWAIQSDG